jgi:hypothetical protein
MTYHYMSDMLRREDQEINMGLRGKQGQLTLPEIAQHYIPLLTNLLATLGDKAPAHDWITNALFYMKQGGIIYYCVELDKQRGQPDKKDLLTLAGQLYRYTVDDRFDMFNKSVYELAAKLIMKFTRSHYNLSPVSHRKAKNSREGA